ncbi:MAG: citrate lyase acyl carrier protein [Clostridia bacterium]|nr:citrate lyase acyl carrier protein [Candidatus Pelethousia sp.]NCB31430.1 citrate lyase acyl carrier protein [Clostridia bacterium]
MQIISPAVAGTMESSDIMIRIEPGEGGVELALDSSVMRQFGKQIEAVIRSALGELGVASARVTAVDKGALDCTVRARVMAAAYRGAGREDYTWEVKA